MTLPVDRAGLQTKVKDSNFYQANLPRIPFQVAGVKKKVQNLFATQLHQKSSTQHPRRACKNGGSSLFQPLRRCVARRGVCQGCVAGCTQWGMPWRYSGRGHRHRHLLAAQAGLHGAYFALVRRLGLSMEDTSVR